ncbi:MAG: hypothetical protein GYB65_16230 [Chloroflexi bacterium]|nr:hypothetical protein [Chloroflexota bacterium]
MTQSPAFQLERLYYGTIVDSSRRTSSPPGVIARTPAVAEAHVKECLQLAQLTPPLPDASSDDMPGTLGLVRGDQTGFILTKAQRNDAGYPQILYILVPVETLRHLGGNVMVFRSLGLMDMPSFSAIKATLVPYELRDPGPLTTEQQADALNDLLLFCQDSFKNVEGILAALVQGWPLAIVNSPKSLEKRLSFLQGLLSMLPVPARVGITFTTHAAEPFHALAQVKFYGEPAVPSQHLVYDWEQGLLVTQPPEDSYSRYMVAQLRLDPSLVIEQTAQLSRTTVWRAMHRENLGSALSWVSRRAAIDQAVADGQPADRDTVAAILREDPTLSDELRLAYARHLLAFAIALDEPQSADVVPAVAVTSDEIASTVVDQITTALEGGQAWVAYSLLERWLLNVPETAALKWHELLHRAAQQHLRELFERDEVKRAVEFLNYIQTAHHSLHLHEVMPSMVTVARESARSDPNLARALFLIAVKALPAGELQRLFTDEAFVRQLPPETQAALSYIQPQPRHPAQLGVLDRGARVFGDGHRMLVLTRFVEAAMFLARPELVDTNGLQALMVITQSPDAERYEHLVEHIVNDFSQISVIQILDDPGPRVLVQLLLHIKRYEQAVELLEFYQNTVFGLPQLANFTRLAGEVCLMTPLSGEEMTAALQELDGSQIRPEPRARMYCSALINRQWADDQDYAARRLTTMIFNDNTLINIIGHDNVINLLNFYARSENALDTLRVGAALVDQALGLGKQGAAFITRMWPSITWNKEVSEAARELLRRFVRGVPLDEVPMLTQYFERELGPQIGQMLCATYLMRQVMAEKDLMHFAEDLHIAAQLFIDIATAYHPGKELPPNHRLRRDLDTMTGGLTPQERQRVAENVLNITRQIFELGKEHARKRGKQVDKTDLVHGKTSPQDGLDVLHFIGGQFAQGKLLPLNLEREAMTHIFGTRSAAMFLRETDAITRLLAGLQMAFEDANVASITPQILRAELASLWGTLSLYNQRQIQQQLAEDCQHLADVILVMAGRVNERVLSNSGLGRQLETGQRQPHTTLEALRWIYGYFTRKHVRTRS